MIELWTLPCITMNNMKFFTNDAPHSIPDEIFQKIKEFYVLIEKTFNKNNYSVISIRCRQGKF